MRYLKKDLFLLNQHLNLLFFHLSYTKYKSTEIYILYRNNKIEKIENMPEKLISTIEKIDPYSIYGYIISISDLIVECSGLNDFVTIGTECIIQTEHEGYLAEVKNIQSKKVTLVLYKKPTHVKIGNTVLLKHYSSIVFPDQSWKGRVINAFAEPLDGGPPLIHGNEKYFIYNNIKKNDYTSNFTIEKIDSGVKAINTFTTFCKGQRMAIIAGVAVGKSSLISMVAKFANSDLKVIALIGERNIEVKRFLTQFFTNKEKENIIFVVATSDESALTKIRATYLAVTIAEYFSDKNLDIILILDSMSRFAMARREIGILSSEIPTSKGYTPSVFIEMPKILERMTRISENYGSISSLITVLLDENNETDILSDSIKSIIDGHIYLDKKIAEKGIFPSINILKSISRFMPECNTELEYEIYLKVKTIINDFIEIYDMLKMGLYKQGTIQKYDYAINKYPLIEKFIEQDLNKSFSIDDSYKELTKII